MAIARDKYEKLTLNFTKSDAIQAFVLSRFWQGFFGGIIIPAGNAILYMSCNKSNYAKVTNFVFLPTLLAPAIALFLGGIIIQYFSYKWIFYINLPICAVIYYFSDFCYKRRS